LIAATLTATTSAGTIFFEYELFEFLLEGGVWETQLGNDISQTQHEQKTSRVLRWTQLEMRSPMLSLPVFPQTSSSPSSPICMTGPQAREDDHVADENVGELSSSSAKSQS
jgi:hypothetical protein